MKTVRARRGRAPERGKYEEPSPAEVAAERKRLLAEKLERERERAPPPAPGAAVAYEYSDAAYAAAAGEEEGATMSEEMRRQRALQLKRDMEAMQNNPGYAPKSFASRNGESASERRGGAPAREARRGGVPLVLVQLFMLATPVAIFFVPEDARRAYIKVSRRVSE